ncbi:hypothetical protein FWK35_00016455 [Aphis craccivora]|uniref:Uncharacterized protein n=1 Tax=Aphis craccivora TaxID=307492 RepID=A0A6G0YC41_APHCR|nr:hypothetical protein FWK35_00016455 [Aphis craccivora]
MMCVFFFCVVYSITSQNNVSISNFGGGIDGKVNILGALQTKIMTEKLEFLYKTSFRPN